MNREPMIVQCCSCQRVWAGGHWKRETAHPLASIIGRSHGYCPRCFASEMARMEIETRQHLSLMVGGAAPEYQRQQCA
jgi:hypothetical protein